MRKARSRALAATIALLALSACGVPFVPLI